MRGSATKEGVSNKAPEKNDEHANSRYRFIFTHNGSAIFPQKQASSKPTCHSARRRAASDDGCDQERLISHIQCRTQLQKAMTN